MFLLRLGTTGVHRTDLRILPETQRPLRDEASARTCRDHALGTPPSARRSLSFAEASHHPRVGAEPMIRGLSRPEPGPAHGFGTLLSSRSQVSE